MMWLESDSSHDIKDTSLTWVPYLRNWTWLESSLAKDLTWLASPFKKFRRLVVTRVSELKYLTWLRSLPTVTQIDLNLHLPNLSHTRTETQVYKWKVQFVWTLLNAVLILTYWAYPCCALKKPTLPHVWNHRGGFRN